MGYRGTDVWGYRSMEYRGTTAWGIGVWDVGVRLY